MIIKLTEQQVLSIHKDMLKKTGGCDGVRDMGMLQSALNAPFQTFDGMELYPSILPKAVIMCRSIIVNHPFVDGNKRTGVHSTFLFLGQNGIQLEHTQQELIEFGLAIAENKFGADEIFNWLSKHCK